ncbi:MAG: hypothetical protein MSG64_08815 [Pyrinomonadaceae bacterium MAG19_C2-C3]|nr:hypothetical protein [Pyrinomonadaceae bacterium MAG19_C2-C3]
MAFKLKLPSKKQNQIAEEPPPDPQTRKRFVLARPTAQSAAQSTVQPDFQTAPSNQPAQTALSMFDVSPSAIPAAKTPHSSGTQPTEPKKPGFVLDFSKGQNPIQTPEPLPLNSYSRPADNPNGSAQVTTLQVQPSANRTAATAPTSGFLLDPAELQRQRRAMPPDRLAELESKRGRITGEPVKRKNGRLKSGLFGLLQGMGETARANRASGRPADAASLLATLGGGAGGFVGGSINDLHDERTGRRRELGEIDKEIAGENKLLDEKMNRQYKQAQLVELQRKPMQEESAARALAAKDERALIANIYNDADELDLRSQDPDTRAFIERAQRAGVPLISKTRRDRVQMQVTPDGRVFLNNGEGEVREATDPKTGQPFNVSRPSPLKLDALTDELFGLPSEKQIEDMARSRVPQAAKTRRIRPEVERMFRNQEGGFDQQAMDDAVRLKQISISDTNESVDPPGVEQALAKERERIRGGSSKQRQMTADFRSRLGSIHPTPNAEPMPLGVLTNKFRQILAMPAGKQQEETLRQFYAALPSFNIQ